MKNIIKILAVSVMVLACEKPIQEKPVEKKAKNIILLIGDGMGLSQVSSSFYYGDGNPNFKRFRHIGLILTSSASHKITESAASATAFSTGVKSYNGSIAMDTDTVAKETILETLSDKGYTTGVVATSSITDATPASFYAHVKLRGMEEEIAKQLFTSSVDFFAGGGRKFFFNRSDNDNLYDDLIDNGFQLDTSALSNEVLDPNQKYGFILSEDGMPRMLDGRGEFLPQACQMAIDHLSANGKEFFLMVEGSQIDWGGHENNAEYITTEVLDFDKVIGLALDFAEKDGNTLVIVTADHETGGYTLSSIDDDYNKISGSFSTDGHTSTLIPVFAYGPGAESFQGIYEINQIYHKMIQNLSD